jgi:DinB superfamily
MFEIPELLAEYDRARAYTDELWRDLSTEELHWRPAEDFSPIGWHLGHQAHVAHFMVRNLTAAEPSPMPDLDGVMDSANPEKLRLPLPAPARLGEFRDTVAERVHARLEAIGAGDVGAPAQLRIVAQTLLTAIINHEYQHDRWIGEVRERDLGHALPDSPGSDRLRTVDGYLVVCGWAE